MGFAPQKWSDQAGSIGNGGTAARFRVNSLGRTGGRGNGWNSPLERQRRHGPRPALIKIAVDRERVTIVIAVGPERGQNSLVTIAAGLPLGKARAGAWAYVCDLAGAGSRGRCGGVRHDRIRHSNQ